MIWFRAWIVVSLTLILAGTALAQNPSQCISGPSEDTPLDVHRVFVFQNKCNDRAMVVFRWKQPLTENPKAEWSRYFQHTIRRCAERSAILIVKGWEYDIQSPQMEGKHPIDGCNKVRAQEELKKRAERRAQIQKRLPEATRRAEQADAQNAANAEEIKRDIANNQQRIAREKDRQFPQSSQENNPAQLPSAQPRVENNFDPSMCDWITTYGASRVIKACFIKSRPARTNRCDSAAYVCEEQEQQVKHGGTSYVFCGPKGSHCPR